MQKNYFKYCHFITLLLKSLRLKKLSSVELLQENFLFMMKKIMVHLVDMQEATKFKLLIKETH